MESEGHIPIIDLTRHPHDPASILNWALDIWERYPDQGLVIITEEGDGQSLDNRLRVKLSNVRNQIKNQAGADSKRFSLLTQVMPWAHDPQGNQRCEALYMEYRQRPSHIVQDAFDKIFATRLQ